MFNHPIDFIGMSTKKYKCCGRKSAEMLLVVSSTIFNMKVFVFVNTDWFVYCPGPGNELNGDWYFLIYRSLP